MKHNRKNAAVLAAAAALCLTFAGCAKESAPAESAAAETEAAVETAESEVAETEAVEETKKALPKKETEAAAEPAAAHYKESMKPFEELVPADRIVILQNTLNYGREGFYTEETKPVTTPITYQDAETEAYPISYTLEFLNSGITDAVTVVSDSGETVVEAEDFAGMYVIIDDFQSGNKPVLYNPETETEIADFLYAKTETEAIYSIITEQDVNVMGLFKEMGWDTTETYRLVATDKFYIPITPEDYDDGELRGALSGSVNASFPDMTIAMGKMNDILYVEHIVK